MASQCNISETLINKIYYVYVALSSRLPLCPQKFASYCKEIKELYVNEIPWYPMNVTLHKILEHSSEYLSQLPPTITSGMLTEEPAESANKDIKKFQLSHANQSCPVKRTFDTFNRLNDRSDPLVLGKISENCAKKSFCESFPLEILNLCRDSDEVLELQNLQ